MAFDYFTVRALASELDQALRGRKVGQVGSSAEALGFGCSREAHIFVRLGAGGYMCLQPGRLPLDLNSDNGVERYLIGAEVVRVWAEERDRIIKLQLCRTARDGSVTYGQLICELIHPYVQVVLISEASGEVLGKWAKRRKGKTERVCVGVQYAPPPQRQQLLPGTDGYDQFVHKATAAQDAVVMFLSKHIANLDKNIAREIVERLGEDSEREVSTLTLVQLCSLWEGLVELYSVALEGGGFIWRRNTQWLFSALQPQCQNQAFDSISEAIVSIEKKGSETLGGDEKKKRLHKRLKKALQATQRREKAVEQDLEDAQQAAEFERWGNILLAQLHLVASRLTEVELPDIYDIAGQQQITIPLNSHISAAENAEKMLKTAMKFQRRQRLLPKQLKKIVDQLDGLECYIKQIEVDEPVNWEEIESYLGELGMGEQGTAQRKDMQKMAYPRRYRTDNGWSIWAGRNNKENDILTHRMAAQNDIWFHAHGYPGSHVVLRREGRKDEPSRHVLEAAAGIAAYWSKGRTAKKVPVVYTLAKYVSKPRGGAPGQALLKREKTLIVMPGLLAEEDQ